MTKKEMIQDIISHTNYSGLNEKTVNTRINSLSRARVLEVYEAFKNDPQHANFYYQIL